MGGEICVNAISPDMIDTSFLKNINPKFIEINVNTKGGPLLLPEAIAEKNV